jgi:hypothetical protein
MTDQLFPTSENWPESTLESVYKAYPRKGANQEAMRRIREALDRICNGEIDSAPRTKEQAVAFLRQRVEDCRQQFACREKRMIPLMSTWLHQSRYLRKPSDQNLCKSWTQERVKRALDILRAYPKQSAVGYEDLDAIAPMLAAIDKQIVILDEKYGDSAAAYLLGRVETYASCVATWPQADLQYVPNALRWFTERRYVQDEKYWQRTGSGFAAERDQIRRLSTRVQ